MDGWLIFSGFFTMLNIEESQRIQGLVRADAAFKLLYIFLSVLSFIRDFKITMGLMVTFFLLKYSIEPYFRATPVAAADPSLDPKQP